MPSPLCDLPAHELSRRIKGGDASALEALESALDRVRAVEGRPPSTAPFSPQGNDGETIHAYITLTEERARAQAAAVDRKVAAGEDPGPLAGVPLSVKDIFCTQGTPSTAGSRILENFIAPYSATAVARLEAAGALTIGKTNLDEFTYGSSNESSAFQPTPRNPWDPGRVPGGSSGGSAAAVAAGESSISLGTDTAGSIRQPAAFCGVVGLKPTYGRVSRYGLIAFASSLDCPGPIGRDVQDVALALGAMAGPDNRDATAASVPVPDYLRAMERPLEGMRVGLSPDYLRLRFPDSSDGRIREQSIDPQIAAAVRHAADALADAGAEIIEDVPMPNTRYGIPVYFVVSRVEAASNLHRYDGVKYGFRYPGEVEDLWDLYRKSRGWGFGIQPKLRILMGMYVSAEQYEKSYYQKALQVRTLIREDFEHIFDPEGEHRLACLLAPTAPTTAFEMGAVYGDSVSMQYADMLTVPANHAGVPALSVPAGLDSSDMPIGIQFIGPDFSEELLFRVGRNYEMATQSVPWRRRRPKVLHGILE